MGRSTGFRGCGLALAADTLGKIGADSPEIIEALAARLDARDLATRRQALHGLKQLGPAARNHVPELLAQLRVSDLQTQQAAAHALVDVLDRDPTAVMSNLVAALADARPAVRASGAYALSRFGPAAAPAVGSLIELLDDPHPTPRAYAVVALGEIGPAAAAALPKLQTMQRERDYRINGWARKAVGQIRGGPKPARLQR
jgi:HEAT repeat protein